MHRVALFFIITAILLFQMPAAAAFAVSSIELVNGEEYTGEIQSIRADGTLTLKQSDGKIVSLNSRDIVEVFNQGLALSIPAKGLKVSFDNGDYILGHMESGDDSSVTIQSEFLGKENAYSFLFDYVSEIRVIENHSREELFNAPLERGDADVVKIVNDDTLYQGTVLEILEDSLLFDNELWGETTLKLNRLQWLSIAKLEEYEDSSQGLVAILKGVNGSRVSGLLKSFDKGMIRIQTYYSEKEYTIRFKDCASISFKNGSFSFLSDMTPVDVRQDFQFDHTTLKFDYQKDRSVSGNPIKLRGKTYRKGLGVHANNALTYDLKKQFKRFRADIGIDDEVAGLGNKSYAAVLFIVELDGKEIYKSPVMTLNSQPEKLDIDIRNGSKLTLRVSDSNGIITQDRANWAGAFLLK